MCTLSYEKYLQFIHQQDYRRPTVVVTKKCICGEKCHDFHKFACKEIISTKRVQRRWKKTCSIYIDKSGSITAQWVPGSLRYTKFRHVITAQTTEQVQKLAGGGEEIYRYETRTVSQPYQDVIPGQEYEVEEKYTITIPGEKYHVQEAYSTTENYQQQERYTTMESRYIGGSGYNNYGTHNNKSMGSSYAGQYPVTKTRTVTKTRPVTRYRTVTKQHPDTFETKTRTVIKRHPDQYITKYRDVEETIAIPTGKYKPLVFTTIDVIHYQCHIEYRGQKEGKFKETCYCTACFDFVELLTTKLKNETTYPEYLCLRCGYSCKHNDETKEVKCNHCKECYCLTCIYKRLGLLPQSWCDWICGDNMYYYGTTTIYIQEYLHGKNYVYGSGPLLYQLLKHHEIGTRRFRSIC